MPRPVLKLVGAELAQAPRAPAARPSEGAPGDLAYEAARLAEAAASFALFGLRLDELTEAAWTIEPADAAYRNAEAPACRPANDPAPAFPQLSRSSFHLDPSMPAKALQALDWVFVLVVAELSARWSTNVGLAALSLGQAAAFAVAACALKAGLWLTESYRFSLANPRVERTIGGLALGVIAGLLAASFIAPDARAAAALATVLPVGAMIMAGVHAAFSLWIAAAHRAGAFSENIVIVGATEAAQRMAARAVKSGEARVLAYIDDRKARAPSHVGGVPVAGGLADLLAWEGLPNVDRIVVAVSHKAEARLRSVIKRLSATPNRVDLLIDVETQGVRGRGVERFAGSAVACVSGRPRNHRRAVVKRAQDVVVGGILLLALSPAIIAIAAAIKLTGKGPVLFRQPRNGFNNSIFTMLKFRTMEVGSQRVTRIGRFLRRYGLDELPQLLNVLKGEMSLVGPRPHVVGMRAGERAAEAILTEYAHRHRVKPGITGWAQVNGARGAVGSPAALRHRVRLDLDYVAKASLWMDLQIISRTPAAMWRGQKPIG